MIAELTLLLTLNAAPLDARIEQGMQDTGTRALAVAIVRDGNVVYQKSFGAPPDRRFYLASSAKSLTALTAKLLSAEGKLDLDAPLTTTLPRLKLPSPLDTSRLSLRDLLTHRSGFESDPVVWRTSYSGEWTDEQLFALLEREAAVTSPAFEYDNLGYILATYAIEHAAGEPWPVVLQKRLLDPLKMTRTSHAPCIGTKSARSMNRGAGGLCATIGDAVQWLRVNMAGGLVDGKQLFPVEAMREVHAPQINLKRNFGQIERYAYGLGWYHGRYDGELLMHHFGSFPGAWAHISWMPRQDIGVVVLADAQTPLPDAVAALAYDTLLGNVEAGKRFDDEVRSIAVRLASIPEQLRKYSQEIAAQTPVSSRTLASYAGIYDDEAYGTIAVRKRGNGLTARIGDLEASLVHIKGDAFYVQWLPGLAPDEIRFDGTSLKWRSRTLRRRQ